MNTLGQIGIQIENVEAVEDFYKNKVGLKHLFNVPGRMTFFDCGGVRLMFAIREPGEERRNNSILYFKVTGLEKKTDELAGKGVIFIEKPHLVAPMPDHDLWMSVFRDVEGNAVGLMEEKPKR